ncbi:zinc-binding dehydrogenase [Solirubrobacter sp. CPCC 204708]|uniref:Medium chain dehydrogenase/reductase family protein n=1 Tax=Solirubrobacter deserti TaxID=2282478 RepID=A0ABT4RUV9_9ACTN|nr:medium chain dehydrogenase/reductase family protein [Solirubrobacter deserti]MBE2319998.1 zinc-binding dehydrogenase [Solirubrobacter deserti]MDA0142364.1 medium chain dehydrogenase/reductase family protein [Solirubrobacter deserti]
MQALQMEMAARGEFPQARTRELPAPRPDQVLVRVEASGVSFAEQQMRRGKYYDQPKFPFVPGYDLVGMAEGRRVAALTKVGGWADHVVLDRADLVPVPDGVSAEAAETVVVNGLTAYRMLHQVAKVKRGQTIVVLGASGGVGTTLVQLARHAGIEVIGTSGPKQLEQVRAMGATVIDHRNEDVAARVRALAPNGVAAVFDHVGGAGIDDSWRMLGKGGTLVSYGTASTRDVPGNPALPVLKLIAKLQVWNALPNGRRATFFNLWAGYRRRDRFRARLRADLITVFELLRDGVIEPQIAARYPLEQAAEALRFAEAGGFHGKVVIVPGS